MRFETRDGSAVTILPGPTGVWFQDEARVRKHFVHRKDLHRFIEILQEYEREFDHNSQRQFETKQSTSARDGAPWYGKDDA